MAAWKPVIDAQIEALHNVQGTLGKLMPAMIGIVMNCRGKLILTGMGKAGLIAGKVSATLRSTGQPSVFLDPSQALHGDMGMIAAGDALMAFSNSGKTDEVLAVMEYANANAVPVIAVTGDGASPMAKAAELSVAYAIALEGCPINRAPMASCVAQLAIGDALAAELMDRRNFTESDFLELHHGGYLGSSIRSAVAELGDS